MSRVMVSVSFLVAAALLHSTSGARVHPKGRGIVSPGEPSINRSHTTETTVIKDQGVLMDSPDVSSANAGLLRRTQFASPSLTQFKVLVLACVLATFLFTAWMNSGLQGKTSPFVLCAIYVVCYVTADVLTEDQRLRPDVELTSFYPLCAFITVEALKLIFSVAVQLSSLFHRREERGLLVEGEALQPPQIEIADAKWFVLSSMLFVVSNLMVVKEAASFAASPLLILFSAGLWTLVFETQLTTLRCVCLCVIGFGLALGQVGQVSTTFTAPSFLSAGGGLISAVFASSSTVANEFALKHDQRSQQLDLNLQNLLSFGFSVLVALLLLLVLDPKRLLSFGDGPGSFFEGFASATLIMVVAQAFLGLLFTWLLKRTDSITMTVASCFSACLMAVMRPLVSTSSTSLSLLLASLVLCGAGCGVYLSWCPLVRVSRTPADDIPQDEDAVVLNVLRHALRYAKTTNELALPQLLSKGSLINNILATENA